jgi:hypothetical protein
MTPLPIPIAPRPKKTERTYARNLLIGIDSLVNALFLGDPQETISSRLGKTMLAHRGTLPNHHPLQIILATILDALDPGHCNRSIQKNVGSRGVIPSHRLPRKKRRQSRRASDLT